MAKKQKKAVVVNLLEETGKEFDKKLIIKDNTIKLKVEPFEIVSLRIKV